MASSHGVGLARLTEFFLRVPARRRQSLSDDVISELIRAEDGGRLTHNELVNLVAILLNAGTDTPATSWLPQCRGLCDHPYQWASVAEHPEVSPQPSRN